MAKGFICIYTKPGAAVESFGSPKRWTRFQRLDFHGVRIADFSVIQIYEKKLLYFQSTMFTGYPPAAELCKDRHKINTSPAAPRTYRSGSDLVPC